MKKPESKVIYALTFAIGLVLGMAALSVPRAEAAGGVIKGDYALHSHGQELFLVNRKTGAVYLWDPDGSPTKWVSQKRSPFDDGYL